MERQYRHGDVFVREVATIPPEAQQEARSGDVILAYGEATGHAHRIASPQVAMWSVGEQRYIAVDGGPAELTHEEHGLIVIPPGTYEVLIQREYDEEKGWVHVLD